MNPYQWLGIDPQIKNPNHFQLLGIKNLAPDEIEFVRQVEKSVKARLSLLDRPELAPHAETVQKLKQKIVLAGKILADSAKRNEYIQQLKLTAQGSVKSVPPKAPSEPKTGESKSSAANTSRGTSSVTSRDRASHNTPPAAGAAREPEIPFAIPMRKPGKTSEPTSPAPTPVKPASTLRFENLDEAETAQAASPLGGAVLKTKPLGRRKTSPLIVIAGSLIAITAMGGLVIVALTLSQQKSKAVADAANPIKQAVENNLESSKTETVSIDGDVKPAANSKPETEDDPETDSVPKTDAKPDTLDKPQTETDLESENIPESQSPPTLESHSKPKDNESAKPDQMPNDPFGIVPEASEHAPTKNPMGAETPDPNERPNDPDSPKTNAEDEPKATTKTEPTDVPKKFQLVDLWDNESEGDPIVLAEADQYLIDKHLRIIMNRQRLRHAKVAEYTDELMEYMEKLYFVKNPEKFSPYRKILFSFQQVNKYLVGFWTQFEEGAATMAGGQEIIVFDRPLSFVEYANDQLVMRGEGFNIRYRREFIPAELAIKIAEQGAIPDIPSWRMCLVAFLATQQDGHVRHQERIIEMIELSIRDGHDVSQIENYLSFRADARPLSLKAEMPDMNAVAAVVRKVQDLSDGMLGIEMDQLEMNELYEHWMKWEFLWFQYVDDWDEKPEFKDEKPLIHTSLALLETAIPVAIMAKDAARLEEAIVELGFLTGQNTDRIFLEHLTKLAEQKLDLTQAIELKRVAEPLIARVEEDRKLRAIANRVQRRIQTFERQHKINGTGQTFGQLR